MFWDKNFQPSQNIEALLEKENVQVEEFLEEDDIIQECKTQKKNILNYFSRPDVIKRMVELITTEPSNELPLYTRFRHAYMACEILTLGIPSLDEKILADAEAMKTLYSYLENEPPLNTLLSSFVIKTLSMLFTKKAEQDWFLYQQTCLQLLEYIKSQNTFLDLICKHFLTPIVPDLIMQMIRKIEGGQLKRNIYEWLAEDKLVERLITILGTPKEKEKHIHVAQFLCDLIIQGRNMRQNDNQDDFFEPVFDGSNPILKNIESETTIQNLLNVILEPNALGSAIVSGITVVLTLIKPVVIMDEPESDRMKFLQKREQTLHEEILNTVIQTIAPRLKNINELMHNPPNETGPLINNVMIPTFGNVRLHVSRLFTALLYTRNEEISKTICETDFLETLLKYFKEYCWNNFLHTEMEKCVQYIFFVPPKTANSFSNGSKNSSSFDNNSKPSNNGGGGAIATSSFYALFNNLDNNAADHDNETTTTTPNESKNEQDDNKAENTRENAEQMDQSENEPEPMVNGIDQNQVESASIKEEADEVKVEENEEQNEKPKEIKEETIVNNTENEVVAVAATELDQNIDDKAENETNINDNGTKTLPNLNVDDKMNISGNTDTPSCLQKHAIVDCKIVPKFLDCWQHNNESETKKPARRLGYMGHLIKIFKHITACISEYEHIGALIESNLTKTELELWQQIIQSETGDLAKILATQSCQLANYNAYDSSSEGFPNETPKDFLIGNGTWDFIMQSNMINTLGAFADSSNDNSLQFGRIADDDNEDEDDENTNNSNDCLSLFTNKAQSYSNPWENPFGSIGQSGNTGASDNASGWPNDFENSSMDNFADFDAHFCRFTSALDTSLNAAMQDRSSGGDATSSKNGRVLDFDFASDSVFGNFDAKNCTSNTTTTEYDSNANVEKSLAPGAEMQRSKGVIGDHLQSATNSNTNTESTQSYAAGRSTEIEDIIMGNDNIDDIINETTTTAISELSKHKKTTPQAFQNVIDSDDDHDTIVNFLKDEEQDADEDDIEEDEGMWTRPFGSSQNNDDSYNNGPIQTFFNSQRQLNETNVESISDTTTTTATTTAPSTINNNINNNNNNDTTTTTTTTNTTDTSDITTTAITDTPNTLPPLDSSASTVQSTTESATTNDAPSDQQEQPNQCDATTVAFTTKETEKESTI